MCAEIVCAKCELTFLVCESLLSVTSASAQATKQRPGAADCWTLLSFKHVATEEARRPSVESALFVDWFACLFL